MSSKHKLRATPGPWQADFGETTSIRSFDNSRICTINWLRGRYGDGGRIDVNEGEANAHLIAAAPDLKDGCNALLGLLQLICARDDVPAAIRHILMDNYRVDEARAAIARAEGTDR